MIPDPIGEAVCHLRDGKLLAYPTETVWGLGADASLDDAVARLRRWKGRQDEPISVLVPDSSSLESLGFRPGPDARRLAETFWPGPLTLVLVCEGEFAGRVARRDGAVGVRCSSHPLAVAIARRLADEGGGPMTATSLNASGEAPARTREEAVHQCGTGPDEPQVIEVDRAESGGDDASTVVDCTGSAPNVLRWGAVSAEDLDPVLEELRGG